MDINKITKVSVFDFDGTLIDTPMPNPGKEIWKEKTGEDYPHVGWWSKPETLSLDVFDQEPFDDIASLYRTEKANPNTFVCLATGRIIPLTDQVHAILNHHGFNFDEVVLAGDKRWQSKGGNTLSFKLAYFADLKGRFPNLEMIEIWDDRDEHHATFVQWGRLQHPLNVVINHVKH
tara:strand:+ start:5169 stop:5696 length:528 start_codon:yes stop_codon:yes gene_type:complete